MRHLPYLFLFKTMTNISIRKCSLADVDILFTISRSTFRETYEYDAIKEHVSSYLEKEMSKDKVKDSISDEKCTFYVAELDGSVVGYMKFVEDNPAIQEKGKTITLDRLYVLKRFQNHRIGSLLIERCINEAQKCVSGSWIIVNVWSENQRAINFYSKYGFSKFGESEFELGGIIRKGILMRVFFPSLNSEEGHD